MGVQEVKAQARDVAGRFERVGRLEGHFHFAAKKGYSGVGIYTKRAPGDVGVGFGCDEFDPEGRFVETRYDTARTKFSVISCHFPSGSSGEERQADPTDRGDRPGRRIRHYGAVRSRGTTLRAMSLRVANVFRS
jgi:exodeoxyribonuclease-3